VTRRRGDTGTSDPSPRLPVNPSPPLPPLRVPRLRVVFWPFSPIPYRAAQFETVRISGSTDRLFAQILVAFILLPPGRRDSFSLQRAEIGVRRNRLKMIKLMRELLVIMMLLGVVSTGAFAQKKDKEKRPPKEKAVVVTNDRKDNRPPPRNSNQRPRPDNRRRPE
jgi:hypothetical protein